MRKLLYLTMGFYALSMSIQCSAPPPDLSLLESYWQIERVTQGGETFYPKAGVVQWDFYQLNEGQGVRKKVTPTAANTFETSNDQTPFRVRLEGKRYSLQFTTPWDQWEEQLVKLDTQNLVLEHHQKQYHYTRRTTDGQR